MRVKIFSALLCLTFAMSATAQQPLITEAAVSPTGDKLAFIMDDGVKMDVLLYSFDTDTVKRITDSDDSPASLAIKSSLSWIDNTHILFLSKHQGLLQQYIIDVPLMSMSENGSSSLSEFDLNYSEYDGGTYYLQFAPQGGNAIFFRKLGESQSTMVFSERSTYSLLKVSPDGRYASVQVSPDMNTVIIDIAESKKVRTKLPSSNAILLAWAPDGNRFLYSEARFDYGGNVTEYLYIYDLEKKSNFGLGRDSSKFIVGAIWSPGSKMMYVRGTTCHVCDGEGNELRSFEIEGRPLCWMPDRKTAVCTNGEEIFLLDTGDGTQKTIY